MTLRHLIGLLALALPALAVQAQDFKAGAIGIDHPHARATAAGQSIGVGYMALVNRGATDRLVSIRAAGVATSVEMHMMNMTGDVMKMRQVAAIDLPAGKTVALEPGGYHLMLVGLKAPLQAGTQFPMELKFEKAGVVTVQVAVEAPGAGK